MNDQISYKGARFYKCALQVNPYSYAAYQGATPQDESAYNNQILEQCKGNSIEIVGLADHGKVEDSEGLRNFLQENSIVVFPGFEICSCEKVHFVCLFPELFSKNDLIGHISKLEINVNNRTAPSKLNAEEIFKKVEEVDGIVFAAHCTSDNGVLKARLNNIWQNPLLKIAQIGSTLESLKQLEGGFYHRAILNKEDSYYRENPIAIINAKDIVRPEDLEHKSASCLIKMTEPTFDAFKQAFYDPESRIRLNHQIAERQYSFIKSIKWQGAGFFEDSAIAFSKHLNAVIGGRGTGKSTLIESIRYALDLPSRQTDNKALDALRQKTLSNSQIILSVYSKAQQGNFYTISRRYGEAPVVQNEQGDVSHLSPKEILPDIELLGQNEILEIEKDEDAKLALINNFLPDSSQFDADMAKIKRMLAINRDKLIRANEEFELLDEAVSAENVFKERVRQFQSLGITDKLKNTQLLEKEKVVQAKIKEQFDLVEKWIMDYQAIFDLAFLQDTYLEELPNKASIAETRKILEDLQKTLGNLVEQASKKLQKAKSSYQMIESTWQQASGKIRDALNRAIAQLPEQAGKTGKELGAEYTTIIERLTLIEKQKQAHINQGKIVTEIESERSALLEEYRSTAFNHFTAMNQSVKKLNKGGLRGKVKISVARCGNLKHLKDFLREEVDGIGPTKIKWLDSDDIELDLVEWSQWIKEKDTGAFMDRYKEHGLTKGTVDRLISLNLSKRLELEEIELKDKVNIDLNTAHDDTDVHYVPLDDLSTGQKCTAILNLLLLSCDDPLIIDQPEDNLDNAFIAERIVQDLRQSKTNRQFLFATHNANIPVFGDAELIAVLVSKQGTGSVKNIGSIDKPEVGSEAAKILEGGKAAFNIRKDKYGF